MRAVKIVAIGCVFSAAAATTSAQDASHVGLTTGYPASIGILWHLSERTAVRPEISFSFNSSSSESLVDATTDFSTFGTGVSMLFFSSLRDNLKLYVAPRFGYSRTSGSTTITESTTDIYSISGSFGGQYALGHKFALFGEAGVQYNHQRGSLTSSQLLPIQTKSHGDSIGTRTAVGVVIYF
jgi:hypothetical protein